MAFDFGYATEENNTHSHSSLGAKIAYRLDDNVRVSAVFQYDISGSDIKEELGGCDNHAWAGVHISVAF